MSDERVRTHWVGCHREHHECAVRLIEDAAAALEPFVDDFDWKTEGERLSESRRQWNRTMPDKFETEVQATMGDFRHARDVLARIRGTGLERPFKPRRVVCWFSCGVTSAVATKLALENPPMGLPVVVAYCASTLSTEHPDNQRFLADCERWFGQSVELLYSREYEDTWDVWKRTGWLVGVGGARCTTELKKRVRHEFHDPAGDIQVFGFDASETRRIERFRKQNPEVNLWAPLHERGISKADALWELRRAGIEIPEMYKLGYKNNNCIGCVKGQAGYWNKIREDFPGHFDAMARLERKMNVAINKSYAGDGKRKRVFLDELPPDAGRYSDEPDIQCGIWCDDEEEGNAEKGDASDE